MLGNNRKIIRYFLPKTKTWYISVNNVAAIKSGLLICQVEIGLNWFKYSFLGVWLGNCTFSAAKVI